jgi:oligoendopeptidase F
MTTALGTMPEWNLADFYASPEAPEFKADLAKAKADAAAFKASHQGKLAGLADTPAGLASAMMAYEALHDLLGRVGCYAQLLHVGDQADEALTKVYGDTSDALTAISSDLIFFELELNAIPDAALDAAVATDALKRWKPWFADLRREKPYQLDEKIEQLFQEKGQTGSGALNRLFSDTMTALRFDVAGEPAPLPLEPTLNLLTSGDASKRKAASDAVAVTLKANVRVFTLITNTLAKDKEISDRWRGFKDVAEARHLSNRVEGSVVDALETAVRAAYPKLSHRYYTMKAGWLGHKPARPGDIARMPHWDRNAPLPDRPERVIPWAEAERIVLDAYAGFAPEMSRIAKRFFDHRWIDAPVRPGKVPGAFSHPTVPSVHPYVLMNYQGKARDVMTLAHELGHGVHQVLAASQGPLLASTPLTLAETASVFGEMLTFKALLKTARDKREKKAMLAAKVEDMINTVIRQIAFYSFERKLHTARREGELTSDQINALWMSVQAESLGPAIELKPGYEVLWTYIPHFIRSPFYVYAYAFGDCLVNSLYALYEDAHPGFVEKYFAMLKAGGSKHHSELLAPFGLDATQPDFWARGLSVIERMIDDLEAMDRAG